MYPMPDIYGNELGVVSEQCFESANSSAPSGTPLKDKMASVVDTALGSGEELAH